jgi:hypothetical protein
MRYRVSGAPNAAALNGIFGLFELGSPKRGRTAFFVTRVTAPGGVL